MFLAKFPNFNKRFLINYH